jgi:hypothetical protein
VRRVCHNVKRWHLVLTGKRTSNCQLIDRLSMLHIFGVDNCESGSDCRSDNERFGGHDPRSHPLTFVRKGTRWCLRRACTFVGSRRFCSPAPQVRAEGKYGCRSRQNKGQGKPRTCQICARVTTVPRKVGPDLRRAILKQLGIDPREFDAA